MTIHFTILGPPRTKKNSSQLVFPGRGYKGWLQQVVNWVRAGCPPANRPKPPYAKVIPSEAFTEWFRNAMTQTPILCTMARDQGAELPIDEPVNVRALIYRERDDGDAVNYYQAIGDFLQAARLTRPKRNGAGILSDDRLIRCWDGSRLLKDPKNPRIQVEITVLSGGQQASLELPPEQVATSATALEMFR